MRPSPPRYTPKLGTCQQSLFLRYSFDFLSPSFAIFRYLSVVFSSSLLRPSITYPFLTLGYRRVVCPEFTSEAPHRPRSAVGTGGPDRLVTIGARLGCSAKIGLIISEKITHKGVGISLVRGSVGQGSVTQ